jgi:hypothetical protein
VGARRALTGRRATVCSDVVARIALVTSLAATAVAAPEAGPTDPHPWWSEIHAAAADHVAPAPLILAPLDALEVTAHLRGDPLRADVSAHVGMRLRLDAEAHLRAKQADADDLATLLDAGRRETAAHARLAAFARRCEGVWRAWQVVLLAPGTRAPHDEAYRDALRALLQRHASVPATADDIAACRLGPWLERATLDPAAPALRRAEAEASLSARSAALATAHAPPAVWFDVDVSATGDRPPSFGLRGGLDLPIERGRLTLAVGPSTTSLGLTWRSRGADDRITGRLGADRATSAEPPPAARAAAEELGRRRDEAHLARSDARRRWTHLCGSDDPARLVSCLAAAPHPDALLEGIDAELAALHAEITAIAASGRDLAALLAGAQQREE